MADKKVQGIKTVVCSECGKEFIRITSNHIYTCLIDGKRKDQCSYTCYRKAVGRLGVREKTRH